ncbi:MAG TPA: hypothetical protein VNV65_06055 [Candidatus Solibacter sp.]|nr:hypothetical protein [Candidatus Solibacter sp.]
MKRNIWLASALIATALFAACGQDSSVGNRPSPVPSTSAVATPSAQPAPAASQLPDFNARLGSNRFAAEAAVAVGRQLFSQGGQYWEVNVRTDPLTLGATYQPAAPGPATRPVNGARSVTVFMATESSGAIGLFRAGGTAHEKAEITMVATLLSGLFPGAATISIQIYFGESNRYATGVYSGGSLDYRVG